MLQALQKSGWILIVIVLFYGLFLRTYDLSLDPPMTTGTFSQDLATDPYHITSFAANRAKFCQWELFVYPKWQVFKVSLPSLVAYLLYSVGEVNIYWTHLAGVIPAFLGLLFLLWCIRRNIGGQSWLPVLVAAIFLATNFILVTYTRAPFLETGVVFYFGLIVLLLNGGRLRLANVLAISVLIALACLSGRIFSITIGLALITTLLLGNAKAKSKNIGLLLGGIIVSGIILLYVLYGDRVGAYLDYLAEHSETSGGRLYLLQGVGNFIDVFLSFGTNNQLFHDSPFLFLAGYLAVVAALLLFRNYHAWFRDNFMLRFGLWWASWMFLFFFPFNYRPLRYSLLLYLPLILIVASVFDTGDIKKRLCSQGQSLLSMILLFIVNLYFLIHFVVDFFIYPGRVESTMTIYAYMLLPAIALTALMVLRPIQQLIFQFIGKAGLIVIVLAGCSLIFQSYLYYQWIDHSHHTTETAAYDMATSISEDAVIAGPYAPRLTLESNIKSLIYYFGLERPDKSIFDDYPITHATMDKSNLEAAVKDFPELQGSMIVTDQLIRGRTVLLLGINDTVAAYRPTPYEKAERFLNTDVVDSALIYNREFRTSYPANIPALKQAYHIFATVENFEACQTILDELRFRHPHNADALFFCFTYYKILGLYLGRPDLVDIAQQCLDETKWLYLGKEENVQRSYDQIR